MTNTERRPKFGDVYYVNFHGTGNTQDGYRPALVFSNNIGNSYSNNVVVLPLTTKLKKQNMPTHVIVRAQNSGLAYDSMVLCENPVCIPQYELDKYITTLSSSYLSKIAEANIISSCAIAYIPPEFLKQLWYKAYNINVAGC